MANLRKFSEKIALHNQKQAEGTKAFEEVMREVSDATKNVNTPSRQHLHINPTLGSFRGGSLPNVNHVANNTVETENDLPNALSQFEELNQIGGGGGGGGDAQAPCRDRGRGVGPMRGRPIEKRHDTSPYGGAYLSPPDTGWRRTNSDSALHQSTQDGGQRRYNENQMLGINFNDKCSEQRPRSCYDSSLVPGINIYPSHNEPGAVQIPIGNNTGSLPDLTSLHFPSGLTTPVDRDDHSSSISTSPQGTSPSTLSPTSLPSRSQPMGKFPFGSNSPQESRVPSPHSQVQNQQVHSPSRRRYQQQPLQNLVISPRSPGGPHSPTQNSPHQNHLQNHLHVPSLMTSGNFLQQNKGVTQNHSGNVAVDGYSQQKFVYQRSQVSPPHVNCSLSPQPDVLQQQQPISSLNTYRSPQPNRPSPQNSPGLAVQQDLFQYRSTSPGESHNSAPQSPASPAGSPGANPFSDSSYYFQAATLQQHFEQINMDWCQLVHSLVESGSGWSAHLQMDPPATAYITSPNSSSTVQLISPEDAVGQELGTDPDYYSKSPSQLQQYNIPLGGGSTQQTTPQTPNTPSSIPDIILTDFSNVPDELTRHELVKDIIDQDFLQWGETLRENLGSIGSDGFQMLSNSDSVISDPNAEDHFRLDRL